MFDIEKSIAEWRRRMLAAGIKSPAPMEELEIHLREAVACQMRSGLDAPEAFETAVRQIGQTGALQTEFAKVGGTVYEQLKHLFRAMAGIPDYQLAANMNSSLQNFEPRWAAYFKTIAFILPAIFLWVCCLVVALPKLKEMCEVSDTPVPKPIQTALFLSDLFKENFFVVSIPVVLALVLLEWRSRWWERRRRLVFGVAAFVLNSTVLVIITAMLVFAVIVGASLSRHFKS
jgi:hypothetical protein